MKNNKSKFEGIKKSFKAGVKTQLEMPSTYVGAALNGALRSEGNLATGVSKGCEALVGMAVAGGALNVILDLAFPTKDEEIVED